MISCFSALRMALTYRQMTSRWLAIVITVLLAGILGLISLKSRSKQRSLQHKQNFVPDLSYEGPPVPPVKDVPRVRVR